MKGGKKKSGKYQYHRGVWVGGGGGGGGRGGAKKGGVVTKCNLGVWHSDGKRQCIQLGVVMVAGSRAREGLKKGGTRGGGMRRY